MVNGIEKRILLHCGSCNEKANTVAEGIWPGLLRGGSFWICTSAGVTFTYLMLKRGGYLSAHT